MISRRLKSVKVLKYFSIIIAISFLHRHIRVGILLLQTISSEAKPIEDIDITFETYKREQTSAGVIEQTNGAFINQTAKIPSIIHQILLAPATLVSRPEWVLSQSRCKYYHPNYEFKMWDDQNTEAFIKAEYPSYFQTWISYPYAIQRADSLRYLVLLKFGGKCK
jgi:mannosyltransferase OCH1-like enzyme